MNTSEFKIIKVTDKDTLEKCMKIRNEVFVTEQNVPIDIEIDEFDKISDKCTHFLIVFNGENAGTVRCLKISDDCMKIQRFCFYKKFRNLGLGKRTLEYLENYYRKANIKKFVLDAQITAYEFYKKCGYEKVSDIFTEAGIEHVKTEKYL